MIEVSSSRRTSSYASLNCLSGQLGRSPASAKWGGSLLPPVLMPPRCKAPLSDLSRHTKLQVCSVPTAQPELKLMIRSGTLDPHARPSMPSNYKPRFSSASCDSPFHLQPPPSVVYRQLFSPSNSNVNPFSTEHSHRWGSVRMNATTGLRFRRFPSSVALNHLPNHSRFARAKDPRKLEWAYLPQARGSAGPALNRNYRENASKGIHRW